MNTLLRTLFGIILASGILIILWHNYRDNFNINATFITSESACISALQELEKSVLATFEERALVAIGGGNVDDNLPDAYKIDDWKPSLESIKLLFNTDLIVDMALSSIRTSIAHDQAADPQSLLNKQKTTISQMFATAAKWCERLPKNPI